MKKTGRKSCLTVLLRRILKSHFTPHSMILHGTWLSAVWYCVELQKSWITQQKLNQIETILTHWSVAQAGSNYGKNCGSKISLDCPFNVYSFFCTEMYSIFSNVYIFLCFKIYFFIFPFFPVLRYIFLNEWSFLICCLLLKLFALLLYTTQKLPDRTTLSFRYSTVVYSSLFYSTLGTGILLYTVHSLLYCTLGTLHCIQSVILYCKFLYTVYSLLYCTLGTLHCIQSVTVLCTLGTLSCTVYSLLYCTLCTLHCIQSVILHFRYSTLYTVCYTAL